MNRILTAIAILAVSVSAFSQGQKPKPAAAKPKTEVKCPVMKMNKVNIVKATQKKMFADYKGRRYFFCCAGCPDAFKKDPVKWSKGAESIPTPKAKPVKKP
jgi:YHS domain-containing protein